MTDHQKIRCIVITPERQAADAEALAVVLPAHDGLVGVLPNHAPFLCKLGMGLLRYRDIQNREHALFIEGGFGHVRDNEVSILTQTAIAADKITTAEADTQVRQAEALPAATIEEVDTRRHAIRRAKYLRQLTGATES
ncbi:MAG: ATP synthase F1 subunit epsilon [Sedimentisphaerales bacterium]|nr:ATP synthase F1 subunit epsilon [Sedimentisphaerales bacterium]